jgi:hypothetical protein
MQERFKEIFEGFNDAHGYTYKTGERDNRGKEKVKSGFERKKVTDELWQRHLDGELPALGIIPINENNQCKWGCIDIDIYNLDHKKLIQQVRKNNLPLCVFRSKSGGAHVFLFVKEFVSAKLMRLKLKEIANLLGYHDSEIFPKQDEVLVKEGHLGSFLNLPYHGGTKSLRYALNDNADPLELDEFLGIYDQYALTEVALDELKINKPKLKEAFVDGPPCLNKLAESGFGEGSRNNALFNIGVFYKKMDPDNWKDLLEEANQNYMNPQLKAAEVLNVIKSLDRKDYDKYRCKDAPINSVCNASLCKTKKYGVGFEEESLPELRNLTKITSTPPEWFLEVDGKVIKLKSEELHSPNMFALCCLDQANLVVPNVAPRDWRQVFLKELLENLQEIKPLESLNQDNQLENLLYDFTVNRAQARAKEDMLNKMSWTEEDHSHFRLEDFYNFARRNNWELDKTKTGNLLKQSELFVEEVRMTLKNQTPRIIKIKAMKKTEPSISEVKYEQDYY